MLENQIKELQQKHPVLKNGRLKAGLLELNEALAHPDYAREITIEQYGKAHHIYAVNAPRANAEKRERAAKLLLGVVEGNRFSHVGLGAASVPARERLLFSTGFLPKELTRAHTGQATVAEFEKEEKQKALDYLLELRAAKFRAELIREMPAENWDAEHVAHKEIEQKVSEYIDALRGKGAFAEKLAEIIKRPPPKAKDDH